MFAQHLVISQLAKILPGGGEIISHPDSSDQHQPQRPEYSTYRIRKRLRTTLESSCQRISRWYVAGASQRREKSTFRQSVWSRHGLRLQTAKNHPFAMRTHNVAAQLSPARPCIHVKPSWPVTSTNVFHPDRRGLAVGIFNRKKNASPRARGCCVVFF